MTSQSPAMIARDEGGHFHFLNTAVHREDQQRAGHTEPVHCHGVPGPLETLRPPLHRHEAEDELFYRGRRPGLVLLR